MSDIGYSERARYDRKAYRLGIVSDEYVKELSEGKGHSGSLDYPAKEFDSWGRAESRL